MGILDNSLIRKLMLGASLSLPATAQNPVNPSAQISGIPDDPLKSNSKELEASKNVLTKAMFEALEKGDIEAAKRVIEYGADMTAEKEDANPLLWSAKYGDMTFTEWLIQKHKEKKQDEFLSKNLPSLMSVAAFHGHTDYVAALIGKGFDVNAQSGNDSGLTPMGAAAASGNTQLMQFLLDRGASVNGVANSDGLSPLHFALEKEQNEAVKWLLEHGAAPNGQKDTPSPFTKAMKEKNAAAALMLLEAGASSSFESDGTLSFITTPLHTAIELGSEPLLRKILSSAHRPPIESIKLSGHTPLTLAVMNGQYALAQILLQSGAAANTMNGLGHTALHTLFLSNPERKGHQEFLHTLIRAGADVNRKNANQNTPLSAAIKVHDVESIRFLVKAGADTNDLNPYGANLLQLLYAEKDEAISDPKQRKSFQVLRDEMTRKYPELIIAVDKEGASLLHYSVLGQNLESVKALIRRGVDVNAVNDEGQTPLHYAAMLNHREIAEYLVQHGADKFRKDGSGKSAYTVLAGKEFFGMEMPIQRPNTPLPKRESDPLDDRNFIGDQIEAIMMFGLDGRPAFYNLWPKGTPTKDMKEINLNVVTDVTRVSSHIKSKAEQADCREAGIDANGNTKCIGNQTLEQAFVKLDDDYVEMLKKYAQYFESRFGMKLRVSINQARDDMPNVDVMGYKNGHQNTSAFADLPPQQFTNSPHKTFIIVNTEPESYTIRKEGEPDKPNHDQRLADFEHEFGHTLGLRHPHDGFSVPKLSLRNFTTPEQLRSDHHSIMSYSKLKQVAYESANTHTSPEWVGPMDLYLRNFMPNPPALSEWKSGYDVEAFREYAASINPEAGQVLPPLSIYHSGTSGKLNGAGKSLKTDLLSWRNIIDANRGYCGEATLSSTDNQKTYRKIPICFVEGGVREIQTYGGHDTVTLPEKGGLFLDMGKGTNEVRALYRDLGNVTIQSSGGEDTLAISKDVLVGRKVIPAERNGLFALSFVDEKDGSHVGSITLPKQLQGKGISHIGVIDSTAIRTDEMGRVKYGTAILTIPVSHLKSVEDWRNEVCNPFLNKYSKEKWVERDYIIRDEEAPPKPPKTPTGLPHPKNSGVQR